MRHRKFVDHRSIFNIHSIFSSLTENCTYLHLVSCGPARGGNSERAYCWTSIVIRSHFQKVPKSLSHLCRWSTDHSPRALQTCSTWSCRKTLRRWIRTECMMSDCFRLRHNSILSQCNHVGMMYVTTHCAHSVLLLSGENRRRRRCGHVGIRSALYPRYYWPVSSYSLSILAIDYETRLVTFTFKFVLQQLCSTESSITKMSEFHDVLPTLYRLCTADTRFVLKSAMRSLVQTSAGLSFSDIFAYCTAFRAFRLCTNKKWKSTCLSL